MHHSTREFGKVKGIHKIFIIFSQNKKTGNGQFFSSGADQNIGKAASGEARRESLRPPIRHAAALLKAGERCALARLWADCGHGGDAFITAVEDMAGARCRLIRLLAQPASPQGEAAPLPKAFRLRGRQPSFRKRNIFFEN